MTIDDPLGPIVIKIPSDEISWSYLAAELVHIADMAARLMIGESYTSELANCVVTFVQYANALFYSLKWRGDCDTFPNFLGYIPIPTKMSVDGREIRITTILTSTIIEVFHDHFPG